MSQAICSNLSPKELLGSLYSDFKDLPDVVSTQPPQKEHSSPLANRASTELTAHQALIAKLVNNFHKVLPKVHDDIIHKVLQNVLNTQKMVTDNNLITIPWSGEFLHNILVFPDSFYVENKQKGTGSKSDVFEGYLFLTEDHVNEDGTITTPSKTPQKCAVKKTKRAGQNYKVDRKLFLTTVSPPRRRLIDGPIRIGQTKEGHGIALHKLLFTDFKKIETALTRCPNPVHYLLQEIFPPVIRAIGGWHRRGFVHRDIKPDNLLLSDPRSIDSDSPSLVTDYEMLRASSQRPEDTRGTPSYMPPSIWGSSENNLISQRDRINGKQRPEHDMYSLAMTFLCAIRRAAIEYKTNDSTITRLTSTALRYKPRSGSHFTDAILKQFQNTYPNRGIFLDSRCFEDRKEAIYIYPKMEERKAKFLREFDAIQFEGTLEDTEVNMLREATNLFFDMLIASDEDRLTAPQMLQALEQVAPPEQARKRQRQED